MAKPTPPLSRLEVLDRFIDYVQGELDRGVRLNAMTRHILGLFHGQPRARAFRRHIAEHAHLPGAGIEVLRHARDIVSGDTLGAYAAENVRRRVRPRASVLSLGAIRVPKRSPIRRRLTSCLGILNFVVFR